MFVKNAVTVAFSAFALLASVTDGHLIMNSPKPYNYYTQPYVQINPLDGVNFRYPCQGNGYVVDSEIPTVVAGGAPLPVNFTGTATHGGGSCQFSISYDDPGAVNGWKPDFQFKTIYSLIGGCPASSAQNLAPVDQDPWGRSDGPHCGNDSGQECIRQFLVPFPKFLKNGRAIFSWTWHNRIGNREIYMNCAPIMITGGTEDWDEINALPEPFLGNVPAIQTDIPGHTYCTTGLNQTVNYPNPGQFGRVLENPTDPEDYVPSGYCSDIRPASMLPSFEYDARTESTYVATDTSTFGPTFVTIPTSTTWGGADTTSTIDGVATETSYTATVTVTEDEDAQVGRTSWASTVTVTLPISTTVTVCSSKSGLVGYGDSDGASSAPTGAVVTSEVTGTSVVEPLPDLTDSVVMFTETFNPVDTAPVVSTWIQPCGSTRPTPGDLTACWH
ncbi:hypothetical protein V8F20_010792 [Naviculisporaceae sp. PSN 640]